MSVSLRSAGGSGTPRLIIQAVFDDKDFMTRMDAMIKGLGRMEAAVLKMTAVSVKSHERHEQVVARTSKSIIGHLRGLRWELVTLIFFVSRIGRGMQNAWKGMEEAADTAALQRGIRALADTYGVSATRIMGSLQGVSDTTLSMKDAHQIALAGLLKDQGYFSEQYAQLWESARVAAVTSGADAQKVFAALVEDLVKGTGAATDAITPIFGLQRALEEYATSIGKTVEQLGHLEAAQVILNQTQDRTSELLKAGADDALRTADSFQQVKRAWSDLVTVFNAMRLEAGAEQLINLARHLETIAERMIWVGAVTSQAWETWTRVADIQSTILRLMGPLGVAISVVSAAMWGGEKFEEVMGAGRDVKKPSPIPGGEPQDPWADEGLSAKNMSRITSHFVKYEDIIKRHIRNRANIWSRFYARQATIESNYIRNSNRINRRFNRTRDRAIRNAARREAALTASSYDRLAQLREKYEMRVKHFTQTFRQRELQNLAMYQYERGMAVAEGDVLAIEDMDARYKLETKAREDNFNLEKRQMKERYELQKKFLLDAMKAQINVLRDTLADQLKEIEIRRKEQLAEEEERRRENLEKANTVREQQLLDEDAAHERSIAQWAAYWRTLAEKTGIGSEEMTAILRAYFGQGGEATKIVDAYLEKLREWERIYRRVAKMSQGFVGRGRGGAMVPQYSGGGAGYGGGVPEPGSVRGETPQSRWRALWEEWRSRLGFQHGGQFIVDRPTAIMVGEGYGREMVTITPLEGKGAMSLRWEGGPIPIQGSGSLAGMDTQGMGDTIAQGILVLLQEQFGGV